MRLEIPQLRAFVAVVELQSFTRAAERLHLTQSAVSWQVKRLEARIGRELLRRGPDGITTTADGRDLMSDALRVLAAHDVAVDRLRRSDLEGRVRFGCAEDLIAERLAGVLGRFQRFHPAVRLEVVVDASAVLRRRVATGDLDTAIIQQPSGGGGRFLWREQPLWVRSRDTVIDRRRPLPLVTFGEDCVYRAVAGSALDQAGIAWFPVLECFSVTGVRAAIAAGVGVGVLAARHLDARLEALDGDDGLPMLGENDFVIVDARDGADTLAAHLIELVLEELQVPGHGCPLVAVGA